MIEEYIRKAKIEMQLKFGNERQAVAYLFEAISLLEDEVKEKDLEIKALKSSAKKPSNPAHQNTTSPTSAVTVKIVSS